MSQQLLWLPNQKIATDAWLEGSSHDLSVLTLQLPRSCMQITTAAGEIIIIIRYFMKHVITDKYSDILDFEVLLPTVAMVIVSE